MKTMFAVLTLSLFSMAALAAPKSIKVCDAQGMKFLQESIADWKKDGFVNVKLMKNVKGATLGFYSWNQDATEMYAEICEYIDSDSAVANSWYYWDQEGTYGTNPASWKSRGSYSISQDEGIATMDMLKTSKAGNVTVKFEITGVEEEIVRSEVVTFANP